MREGLIQRDPAQEIILARLEQLCAALANHRLARKSSALGWMFARSKPEKPKGLYIWGSVGRGKTFLMDLFFNAVSVQRKRRVHFHAFMGDVHARIHAWRLAKKEGHVAGDDPIAPVAQALAEEAWLLCFDEFAVTDIADAMILGRLFKALFAAGVVVVATSNVAPANLYRDGLNRALFLPFIEMIGQHMDIMELDAPRDYRQQRLSHETVWICPADKSRLDGAFEAMTHGMAGEPDVLHILGRDVHVPCHVGDIARFSFAQLCEQPLGAADHLAIARRYGTVFIDDIPVFGVHQRNEAKRFIILIDTFYDLHVKLFATAQGEPEQIGQALEGREAFEFERTASRLTEMRSDEWLAGAHAGTQASRGFDTGGLVET